MGKVSAIEWTDATFNPWLGCEKVSPECTNCYAATADNRFSAGQHWGKDAPRKFYKDGHWNEPLKWNAEAQRAGKRWRVFCASQADVFEDRRDLDPLRDRLFALIDATPSLDWLLLTKRAREQRIEIARRGWRPNVWAGVSVGCKETLWRLDELVQVNAAVRFVSAEPLLEEIDIRRWFPLRLEPDHVWRECLCAEIDPADRPCVVCAAKSGIDWVIGGGESGMGKRIRPTTVAAARSLRDQCLVAGVPFLWKQWGQHVAGEQAPDLNAIEACTSFVEVDGEQLWRVRKKKDAGRLLDGRTWDGYPTPRAVANA